MKTVWGVREWGVSSAGASVLIVTSHSRLPTTLTAF